MPSERVQRRIDRLLDRIDAAEADELWDEVRTLSLDVLDIDTENDEAAAYLRAAERRVGSGAAEPVVGGSESALRGPQDTFQTSDSSVLPTSFANGRYVVERLLGEGGKKKVYLAHDTTLDRDVAFGLIKAEGLDAHSRQRITREAQAMARLGDHPNLMPIFDLGEENGQPYMVQPLMVGGDVEALIAEAEDGRLALEDALRISIEICRGLEFAHAKGIIHRDLKPGNVWLTDDGTVRIGDFGLALSLDRSRLTQDKVMVGTVSYMPPEQATGGEVTAQADLYSLGAMLYEMVTGRPPFMGDDDIGIIGQHINTPPVAPSWHNKSLPQTLDALIIRLLSKDPAERPESATELLQALSAIDPASASSEREEEQGSLDSMSAGVFVGRHREMDQLKAMFEETLAGHGKMAALVGEPGIGKTRTAQELATYASMRGGQVLWGRCYEGGGAPPYYPWVQAIRSYVMDRNAETIRQEMGSTASVIAEIVPDVKEQLPDLQPPPPVDDPESARFRLFDSITTFLKSASASQPIVLMLEDLHWSDKPSLMLLEFVARELGNSRLMIVGNYRDMELNRRHPLSITLGELSRERLFDRVLLRGLQKHDVRRFIEVAAGIDPPEPLVDAVFTQTEGNPLFVTETVRLLIQEGDIASGANAAGGTSSWEIRIPEGVREVIGRRLDRLSERCNEVLTTAAVIGRQFRFGVLLNLVDDISENMLLDVLDEALNARIVEEIPTEVGLYQFAHALMQETLTSELSANRLVRLHARIAGSLEEYYGESADDHAPELVEHFAEAEVVLGPERLIHYSLVAGKAALGALAWEDAQRQFERAVTAIRAMDDPNRSIVPTRMEAEAYDGWARSGAGAALMDTGEFDGTWSLMKRAHQLYLEEGDSHAAIEALLTPIPLGPLTDTVEVFGDALSIVEPMSAHHGWVLTRLGTAFQDLKGDTDRSRELFAEAIDVARSIGNKAIEARAHAHWCQTGSHADEPAEGIEHGLMAIAQAKEADDPPSATRSMAFIAESYAAIGQPEEAMQVLDETMSYADERRFTVWSARGSMHAAGVLAMLGRWDEAEAWIVRARSYDHTEYIEDVIERNGLFFERSGEIDSEAVIKILESMGTWPNSPSTPVLAGNAHFARVVGDAKLAETLRARAEWILTNTDLTRRAKTASLQTLAMVAPVLNEPELAKRALAEFDGDIAKSGIMSRLCHDRIVGIASAYVGELERAEAAFERSMEFARGAGYLPELAWTCSDYAEMLRERDTDGDGEKATDLYDEAVAIATELGMKPLLERLLAHREMLKA